MFEERVRVPAPVFVRVPVPMEKPPVLMAILPSPAKVRLVLVPVRPPESVSVSASEPMVVAAFRVIAPA